MKKLYRHHGFGDIHKIHPIITKYSNVKDYNEAITYNLIHKPLHALFSEDKIINKGSLTLEQANLVLQQIGNLE